MRKISQNPYFTGKTHILISLIKLYLKSVNPVVTLSIRGSNTNFNFY